MRTGLERADDSEPRGAHKKNGILMGNMMVKSDCLEFKIIL